MAEVRAATAASPDYAVSEEQTRRFAAYIADRKIVIADANQSVRSGLSKVLVELGAKGSNIHLAANYAEAEEKIVAFEPEVIICDYNLGEHYGLELIEKQREARPELESRLFILVTGNAAESVVAEAAEEEVDAYVLKPFTGASIRYYLVRAGLAKLNPSEYRLELGRGKQLFYAGQYEKALQVFTEAMSLDEAPALACYYMGQSYDKLGKPEHTEQSYKNGLIFNQIHYKCSVALFDFYAARGQAAEAYGVMKNISRYFPVSPQRLAKALELAVRTQNFDDIEHYYGIFSRLDERRDDLRKCVCAALVVGAMFKLRHRQTPVALDMLQKAAATAGGSTVVLREIVLMLVNFNLVEPAQAFLRRFPPETQGDSDYLCADFAVLNLTGKIEDIIVRGRKLLRQGVQDPLLHKIMIRREAEFGHADAADQLATEAMSIWPQNAEEFRGLLS
jgi:CheY-like chemotaxis protein